VLLLQAKHLLAVYIMPDMFDCCRYCPSTSAAISVNGTSGFSLYFLGRFYDNLSSKRRGVSSLGFPKPKLNLGLDDVVSLSIIACQLRPPA